MITRKQMQIRARLKMVKRLHRRGLTQEKIADLIGVTQRTISGDLIQAGHRSRKRRAGV